MKWIGFGLLALAGIVVPLDLRAVIACLLCVLGSTFIDNAE